MGNLGSLLCFEFEFKGVDEVEEVGVEGLRRVWWFGYRVLVETFEWGNLGIRGRE